MDCKRSGGDSSLEVLKEGFLKESLVGQKVNYNDFIKTAVFMGIAICVLVIYYFHSYSKERSPQVVINRFVTCVETNDYQAPYKAVKFEVKEKQLFFIYLQDGKQYQREITWNGNINQYELGTQMALNR